MILEAILTMFFNFIEFLLNLLPDFAITTNGVSMVQSIRDGLFVLLHYGFAILPIRCWDAFIGTVALFTLLQFGWAIFEWIYKKIPGVD